MFQHYVTGSGDDNFGLLASIYGVPASSIAEESGYSWSTSVIYNWLASHNGTKQTRDASVATGYHWSFTPGMVLNIPGDGPSRSPVRPGAIPGGPGVVVDVAIVDPGSGQVTVVPEDHGNDVVVGPAQASASGGLTNIILAGVAVGAVLYLFSDKKGKGKGRARKSRKPARKTRKTSRRSRR